MSQNKTLLNIIEEEWYHLIAVHCSREAYQVAYFLNQHLGLKLKREKQDVDFKHEQLVAFYPIFHYLDGTNGADYYLVANRFGGKYQHRSSGALFPDSSNVTTHLLSEYKNVDYFLKIEDETEIIDAKKTISDLNKVPQIITAYNVDVKTLKSQENLIFN